MKIRGTAMHIAEKYTALARDAMASGDIVMAENYLQHAEHYNRIIMASQAQNAGAQGENGGGYGGNGRYGQGDPREFERGGDGEAEEDEFVQPQRALQEPGRPFGASDQPQPFIPQPVFPGASLTAQNTPPVINGSGEQPVVSEAAFSTAAEGERAPRRRRRRPPMGEDRAGFSRPSNGSHADLVNQINGGNVGGGETSKE